MKPLLVQFFMRCGGFTAEPVLLPAAERSRIDHPGRVEIPI
jgi:hypothetical protein